MSVRDGPEVLWSVSEEEEDVVPLDVPGQEPRRWEVGPDVVPGVRKYSWQRVSDTRPTWERGFEGSVRERG